MKLATYRAGGRESWGAVVGDGIVDLAGPLGHPTLRAAIAAGALTDAAAAVSGATPSHRLAEVELEVPIPDAAKIVCIGRNYRGHVAEVDAKLPPHPSVFLRTHESMVPPGGALVRPRLSDHFDYEGELAVVIGTGGRHIAAEDALSHICAYTILNDGSIRDYQFDHSLTVGKNFAATGSWGPWIVTADEIPDPSELMLATRLNGEQVQHSQTNDFIFDIPTIIAYVSAFTPLAPGDVVSTGTPEGVGFARKPPLWLKPGDTVEVELSRIGVLRNTVTAEA